MKKENIFIFLFRVIVSNVIAYVIYNILLTVLNLFTGGGYAIFSGAQVINGWTIDDLSPAMRIFIPIMVFLCNIITFLLFYLLMAIIIFRFGGYRESFLIGIGAEHFDRKEFTAAHMKKGGTGRQEFIAFSLFITLCSVLALFVGILELLVLPQLMLGSAVASLLPITGIVRIAILIIISIASSIAVFYVYETQVIPRICEKWADERIRKD